MQILRKQCEYCIMLSGSPIDNTWVDLFAITQFIHGHPFDTLSKFQFAFGTEGKEGSGAFRPPSGHKLARFGYLLNAFIVRRPESTVALPPLSEEGVTFNLTESEIQASNDAFAVYLQSLSMSTNGQSQPKNQKKKKSRKGLRGKTAKKDMKAAWGALTEATQHHEVHVHEVHAHEMHAHEVHAHEVHAHEMHAHEVHAHEVHGHEVHGHEVHDYEVHAYEVHAHEVHAHEAHAMRYTPMRYTS